MIEVADEREVKYKYHYKYKTDLVIAHNLKFDLTHSIAQNLYLELVITYNPDLDFVIALTLPSQKP